MTAKSNELSKYKNYNKSFDKVLFDLGERKKEFKAVLDYQILIETPGISLPEILQGTVNLLPSAMQYPEITCAHIKVDDQEYRTENFHDTEWKLVAPILMEDQQGDLVEVCYLEERPGNAGDPFLDEERVLINYFARRIGRIITREKAQKSVFHLTHVLSALRDVNQLITREQNCHILLKKSCELMIASQGYISAWIVLFNEQGQYMDHAESGVGNDFDAVLEELKKGNFPPCISQALRQAVPFTDTYSNSPCSSQNRITSRLAYHEEVFGVISVSIGENLPVEAKELSLFKELAEDIAFALYRINLEEKQEQAKNELKKNIEYQNTFFKTTSLATVLMEEDTTLLKVNKQFERLSGYSREEIENIKSWTEFVLPKDLERMRTYHHQRRNNPQASPIQYEFQFVNKAGQIRDILINVDLIPGTKKSVGALLDITERKKAENKIYHFSQVLSILRDINHLITHEQNREALLQKSCKIMTDSRGYHFAWILLFDQHGKYAFHSEAGIGVCFSQLVKKLKNNEYPTCIKQVLSQSALLETSSSASECVGCVIRNCCANWRHMISRLEYDGRIYGVILASIENDLLIDEQERSLYEELAEDIAFALYKIELEKKRRQAEEKLQFQLRAMEFEAQAAAKIARADNHELICNLLGQELYRFLPEDYVIVSYYDPGLKRIRICNHHGFGRKWTSMLEIISDDLDELTFSQDELKTESIERYLSGRIFPVKGGIFELFENKVPKHKCEQIEALWGYEEVYYAGISVDSNLLGGVVFLTKDNKIQKYKTHIESLVNLVAVVQAKMLAETASKQSEKKYFDLVQNLGEGIIKIDLEARFTFANAEAEKIFGVEPGALIGQKYSGFVNRKTRQQLYNQEKNLIDGKDCRFEIPVLTKSGNKRYVSATFTPQKDETGKAVEALGILHDITARKHAEGLLNALNQAALCMGKSQTHYDIFNAVAKQLRKNGLFCVLLLLDESGRKLDLSYLSSTPMELKQMEQLFGIRKDGFAIDIEHEEIDLKMPLQENKAVYVEALDRLAAVILPKYARNLSAPLSKQLAKLRSIIAPLFIDNCSIGVFCVFSNNLLESDINIITAFVDQLSSAWKKVNLLQEMETIVEGTIHTLASVVEARDPYTAGHQRGVAKLAAAIAIELGLSKKQIEGIRMAGLIHDIGKIQVPPEILSKPGELSELEFGLIKIHPQAGYDMLKNTEFPWPIAQMVLQHHEKQDGSGYPQGLKGDEIMLEARILTVADIVEAVSSHRPYRPALGIDKALEIIQEDSGILLDREVVSVCLRLFERGYTL